MMEICKKELCTGCAACYNACPHNAIEMSEDECGYFYPRINNDICINCGLCKRICPVNTPCELVYPIKSYAVTTKNLDELMSCASGGAATLLSRAIINEGGVVFGCDGKDIRRVHHAPKETNDSLDDLKGSKYVHSYIGDIYQQVKIELEKNRLVLFIGTPCQVAGLKAYLRQKNYLNLYTVDLVCHGVSSQKMLIDNINYYANEKDFVDVSFREKNAQNRMSHTKGIKYGWYMSINKQKGGKRIAKSLTKDAYIYGFISCLTIRDNCSSCRYACIARCSDITISDFWGLHNSNKFEKGRGVSNVLINTSKGEKLWERIKDSAIFEERSIVEALVGNGRLQSPELMHPKHEQFKRLYPQIGFKRAVWACSRKNLIIHYLKSLYSKVLTII